VYIGATSIPAGYAWGIFGIPFLIILVIIFLVYLSKKATADVWASFAHQEGLLFQRNQVTEENRLLPNPKVNGKYRGLDYSLFSETKSAGKNQANTYTCIEMYIPKVNNLCDFHLSCVHFLEKFFVGLPKSITIGHHTFYEAFRIQSKTPDKLNQVLTPELIKQIVSGRKHLIHITVTGNKIFLRKRGIINKIGDLNYVSEVMFHIAKNIAGEDAIKEVQQNKDPSSG